MCVCLDKWVAVNIIYNQCISVPQTGYYFLKKCFARALVWLITFKYLYMYEQQRISWDYPSFSLFPPILTYLCLNRRSTWCWPERLVPQYIFCRWLWKEVKRKKSQSGTESLVHSLRLLGSKQRSHSRCLSRTWQLLEESCLLLASVSHFGMGGSSLSP